MTCWLTSSVNLETTKGADEDLIELKRKMGLAPPKAEPVAAGAALVLTLLR